MSNLNLIEYNANSLDSYLNQINSIEIFTAQQEKNLVRNYIDNDCVKSARTIILSHLRFVAYIARSYKGYGLAQNDLIQEGTIGLMKALKRFNPDYGVRLVSFAVYWIKSEIHEFILKNWRIVKIATTKAQRKLFFSLRKNKKSLGWFSDDEVKHVASKLNVSKKEVLEMEKRVSAIDDSIEYNNYDNDNTHENYRYLEDTSSDLALEYENKTAYTNNINQLTSALKKLDKRALTIIKERYINEDKSTLHDLAKKLNVSAERVRQLEKNALNKLKTSMS